MMNFATSCMLSCLKCLPRLCSHSLSFLKLNCVCVHTCLDPCMCAQMCFPISQGSAHCVKSPGEQHMPTDDLGMIPGTVSSPSHGLDQRVQPNLPPWLLSGLDEWENISLPRSGGDGGCEYACMCAIVWVCLSDLPQCCLLSIKQLSWFFSFLYWLDLLVLGPMWMGKCACLTCAYACVCVWLEGDLSLHVCTFNRRETDAGWGGRLEEEVAACRRAAIWSYCTSLCSEDKHRNTQSISISNAHV